LDHPATHGSDHVQGHDHHDPPLPFWRKYIFSLDHKVIGIQYAITGLLFLLFGFCLMMIMRYQLAYPGQPIPLRGATFFRSLIEVQLDRFTIYWDRVNLRANQETYVPGFLIPKFGSTFGVRWEFSN